MKSLFEDLSPLAPFRFFEEISAIPRASGNEAGIAAYLMRFAGSRGLSCCEDAIHNVLIQKPASPGREGEPALLLQCHTDMVAEKHGHVAHDFEKEGIHLLREGNILRADGTTLGADDGFGVALILAVLDDAELSHPALECLFTVSEEIGLEGAGAFDYTRVSARRMINLDSAEEDTVIIGCCGGLRTDLTVPLHFTDVSEDGLRVRISGLCGGHSGEDIDRGRLNAHVLMGAVLRELQSVTPF
ncbi:MAG: aminoacyl-histidine dipeptidase, partial [Ruminococcaceae bacterium]|nr:aminoacyl-histidine dipeptidase [Oscillospiraceae bacterium]